MSRACATSAARVGASARAIPIPLEFRTDVRYNRMSFSLGRCQVDKRIQFRKIGVVGSGQIGPDIALHFAKALASRGVPVVVVDTSPEALQRGRAKVDQ